MIKKNQTHYSKGNETPTGTNKKITIETDSSINPNKNCLIADSARISIAENKQKIAKLHTNHT